jgi:hypothetical protein
MYVAKIMSTKAAANQAKTLGRVTAADASGAKVVVIVSGA